MTDYVYRDGRRIEVETVEPSVAPRRRTNRYIGCPLEWLRRVLPIVKTKEQLAVALWLRRRRVVCNNELFTVPNRELHEELSLSRKIKYQTLQHLEAAGVIATFRDGKSALRVRMLC